MGLLFNKSPMNEQVKPSRETGIRQHESAPGFAAMGSNATQGKIPNRGVLGVPINHLGLLEKKVVDSARRSCPFALHAFCLYRLVCPMGWT